MLRGIQLFSLLYSKLGSWIYGKTLVTFGRLLPAMRAKDSLKNLGVIPSKRRGQNFTIDSYVVSSLMNFSRPDPDLPIVEIGPGLGALTEELLKFGPVTAIEIETQFVQELRNKFSDLKVVEQDVRTFDLSSLAKKVQVFGNLPYSISTDIVMRMIEQRATVKAATFLLQREFVERLAAQPGGRDFGSLTIAVQLYAEVTSGPVIPGTMFHPPTKVESQVVKLTFLEKPRVEIKDLRWFEIVMRAIFQKRRKQLGNGVKGLPGIAAEDAMRVLEEVGIEKTRRAETLSIEEFAKLVEGLAGVRGK